MKKHFLFFVFTALSTVSFAQVWTPGTGILYANPITTKVGIGTATPATNLDITGNLNVSGIIGFGSTFPSGSSTISKTGGTNGDVININVNGRGGIAINTASFSYDNGIKLNALGQTPNIYFASGGSTKMVMLYNGNLGIGCTNPTVKLAVNGKIQATEIEIKSAPCSDYVFEPDYKFMNLAELDAFIKTNKHLPEVPSATEFSEKGYNVGEMDDLLLRKIEELTLYAIELQKQINELKK